MNSIYYTIISSSLLLCSQAHATVVYSDDLSTNAGFTVVADADTSAIFGYDYSADGIPSAPNGTGTTGLKLQANIANGVASEIAAVHALGFSNTPYRVKFDAWINYSIAGGSSTEFIGGGVGHNGTGTGRNGASILATGDGGSSRDYRLYKDDSEQFFASGIYSSTLTSNNGSDLALSSAFLAKAAPGAQGQVGTSDAGDMGFEWVTFQIDVDPNGSIAGTTADKGTATFTLTSSASGNSVVIGTIDNSDGSALVDVEGNFSLIYADLFSSVAGDTNLQFGLYDNVVIETVPEPSSSIMIALAAMLVGTHRKRSH